VVRVKLTLRGAGLARRLDAGLLERLTRLMGLLDAGDRRDLFRIIGKLTAITEEQNA
jgi:hypothetical protein